jgi:hypothetical protein
MQAGGVEVLEFCLFLKVFLAWCISGLSVKFYFRKHIFCFLPLAAILESLIMNSKSPYCYTVQKTYM